MRTNAFLLTVLAATTASPAYSGSRPKQFLQSRVESILALQNGQSPSAAPMQCNGGPCTFSGGPSGGPNQS